MAIKDVKSIDDERNSMDEKQIAHLAGVFDAIGGVSLRVINDSDYRLNHTIEPSLTIRRPNEEDPLLGKLMEYCDDNQVQYSLTDESHGSDSGSSSIKWVVKDPDSVERFLEPMMDYLVTNYFRAELMLEVTLPAIRNGKHREKQGFYELIGVADKLREGKSQRREPKYTQEYFSAKWSISE